MAEIIDIINDQDEVVGQARKDDAHKKHLLHRIGVVYVFCGDSLLVQKRSVEKDGLLDHSSAGHVHAGETYEQAAMREMREEIGLDTPIQFLGITNARHAGARDGKYTHRYGVYTARITPTQAAGLALSSREVSAMIPMTIEDIKKKMKESPGDFSGGFFATMSLYDEVVAAGKNKVG